MARQTIAVQLEKARVILDGVKEGGADMTTRLTAVGYTAQALTAGRTLYENAGGARVNVFAERGDQKGATANVIALRQQVESQYSTLAQIAGTVFKDDPDAYKTLGLGDGQMARPRNPAPPPPDGGPVAPPAPRLSEAQAAFFDRARVLYTNALNMPEIASALDTVGYSQTRLTKELTDLKALEDADTIQEAEKAEARASTAAQRAALALLNEWVSRFSNIVVPALKDRPDLLAKLGLKPRGGKR